MSIVSPTTLYNRTLTVQAPAPVTFQTETNGEVVIESNAPATLTRQDGVVAAEFVAAGRQQLRLRNDTYTLAGNARVTIREITAPQPGVHLGSPDGQPIPRNYKPVGR
jgi:hypothetical protein